MSTIAFPSVRMSRRRRRIGIGGAVLLFFILGYMWGSDRPTAAYWHRLHEIARQADDWGTKNEGKALLTACRDLEAEMAKLDASNVDPVAIDAGNRFRALLRDAASTLEYSVYLEEHPVRAAAGYGVSLVFGGGPLVRLEEDLLRLRSESQSAYRYAAVAQRQLKRKYPFSSFAAPIPPDVHELDEILRALRETRQRDEEALVTAFDVGTAIGAILGLMASAFGN